MDECKPLALPARDKAAQRHATGARDGPHRAGGGEAAGRRVRRVHQRQQRGHPPENTERRHRIPWPGQHITSASNGLRA